MTQYRKPFKSAAQILVEHGFSLPAKVDAVPIPGATDRNGPVTDELRNSKLARIAIQTGKGHGARVEHD